MGLISEHLAINLLIASVILSARLARGEIKRKVKIPYYVIEATRGNLIYRAHLEKIKDDKWQFSVLRMKEKDGLTYYDGESEIPLVMVSSKQLVLLGSEEETALIAQEIKRANKSLKLYAIAKQPTGLYLTGIKEEKPPLHSPKYKIIKKGEGIPIARIG